MGGILRNPLYICRKGRRFWNFMEPDSKLIAIIAYLYYRSQQIEKTPIKLEFSQKKTVF